MVTIPSPISLFVFSFKEPSLPLYCRACQKLDLILRFHLIPFLSSFCSYIIHQIAVLSTGQSVSPGPRRGRTTLCRPVWSFLQTCPATYCQGLGPHRPPGEMSHTSRPAVPRSPPQSPYSPVLFKVTGDHSLFSCHSCVLLFTHLYYIYYCSVVSFVVDAFPGHSLFSAVTRFGLMELEMTMFGREMGVRCDSLVSSSRECHYR